MTNYQVYKIHSDFYYVKNLEDKSFEVKLRDVLKKQKIEIKVGDFVELSDDLSFITRLLKRSNTLSRPKVSNIDLALVVCSLKEPELDFIQLNRYLIYLKYHNIDAAICFNKEDLVDNLSEIKNRISSIYKNLNYNIFFISAKNKLDLDDLNSFIKNKTIVLCGLSGVGKSTLLNSLNPEINIRTGEVSSKNSRGRHTTRHTEIINFGSFKIIDTPGFSCLKFDFLLPSQLINLFDDLKIYKNGCKYSDCLHNVTTSGICSVYDNLDKISPERYSSYLCFLEEAISYKESISKRSIKKEEYAKFSGDRLTTKISKRKRNSARNTDKQKISNFKRGINE